MAVYDYEKIAVKMYKEYNSSVENNNYLGKEMPQWKALPARIQNAWIQAAIEAHREFLKVDIEGE